MEKTKPQEERAIDRLKLFVEYTKKDLKIIKGYSSFESYCGLGNGYILNSDRSGKSKGIKYLTIEQINQIRSLEIASESIDKVRDLFIFQCFTGLSYADLFKFDFSTVIERKNKFFIRDVRVKTQEEYFLMLLKPAMEILRKYDFKLPAISNYQYNLRLKIVQELAKIKLSLHSHMARHSFAVMALNMGVSIENLAKMLGHTDIKTTQIYAKVLNKSVQEEFEKMDSKL